MPFITARNIKYVTHIGHLDPTLNRRSPSIDGPGIAVSNNPQFWREVRGLNGPEVELAYSPALWVDALSMTPDDIEDIKAWMIMRRYMVPITAWAVSWHDAESDRWTDEILERREEACRKAGISLEEDISLSSEGAGATTEVEHFKLEKRAMRRLGGWPDPLRWHDAAILLYVREVVMEKRPFVVGVWWDEAESKEEKTAPYGVLFPERLVNFTVEDEDGEVKDFKEAFPEFTIPDPKNGDAFSLEILMRKMKREEEDLVSKGMTASEASRTVAVKYFSAA